MMPAPITVACFVFSETMPIVGKFDGGSTGTGNEGTLNLEFTDGDRSDITLEYRGNNVFLEGVQWLRDPENG